MFCARDLEVVKYDRMKRKMNLMRHLKMFLKKMYRYVIGQPSPDILANGAPPGTLTNTQHMFTQWNAGRVLEERLWHENGNS